MVLSPGSSGRGTLQHLSHRRRMPSTGHARVTIPHRKWPILAGFDGMSRAVRIFDVVAGKMHDQHGTEGGDAQLSARRASSCASSRRRLLPVCLARTSASALPRTPAGSMRRGCRRHAARGLGSAARRPSWKDVKLVQLDEATKFATDRDISDPVQMIPELKRHPEFLKPMQDDEAPVRRSARSSTARRMGGTAWLATGRCSTSRSSSARTRRGCRSGTGTPRARSGRSAGSPSRPTTSCSHPLQRARELLAGDARHGPAVIAQAVRHDPEAADFWMADSTGWNRRPARALAASTGRSATKLPRSRGARKQQEQEDRGSRRGRGVWPRRADEAAASRCRTDPAARVA